MAENSNLYACFESVFDRMAEEPAFEIPGHSPITYGEFQKSVGRTANALEALGVGARDRVMVQVDKSVANVGLYLATLKIGAVYCPLNTAYKTAEVESFIADCQPKLFVGSLLREEELSGFARKFPELQISTLSPSGGGTFGKLVGEQSADHNTALVGNDDIAAIVYTSGTTGRSKGAMLAHGNLVSNARTLHELWQFQPGDVLLHALPIYHVHGLFIALHTAFLAGSKIIWLEKFNLSEVLKHLPLASVMMGVPTYYTRLLGAREFDAGLCRKMRLFISGSAPLLAETHSEFERRSGHRILERYGMSETGMITSNAYRPLTDRKPGSVGYALPGVDIRVADDAGNILGPDETGVLELRGPNVFKGYWRRPEITASEFRDDGFFITGDLATIDSFGRVTLVGRSKDLIISGGLNVYPREIELEIDCMEGVLESAVIGVPHDDLGEAVIAIIVADGDAKPPGEGEILKYLKQRLAGFKLPKKIIQLEALPRNAMGKVQKVRLRKEFADLFPKQLKVVD